jgi:NADH:ubiquinone oxidoreductase subunit 5 (subunit L)/multisubunit Na+/H+ antiporter MnhA subunit
VYKKYFMQLKDLSKSRLLDERVKYTTDLARLSKSNPTLAFTLTVVMFSLAGIPPLAGFYSKAFLLFAAIRSAHYVLALVGILMSAISAFYYIRIVKIMYFESIVSPGKSTTSSVHLSVPKACLGDSHPTAYTNTPLQQNPSPAVPLRFAGSMLSFTQINKEISLVCASCVAFLLFFSLHPKPLFLITNKSALLLTLA